MALTLQNWGRISTSANEPITTLQNASVIGAPRWYSYDSIDTQATIAAAGYFNAGVANQGVSTDLVTGDVIAVWSRSDDTVVLYKVTNTDGVITTDVFAAVGPINTADITDHAVTYAKIQQEAAVSLLGNPTGGLANVQAITLGNGLAFSGTTLRVPLNVAISATVSMSSADWNGMYAAPFLLAAAGGANTMIVVDSLAITAIFGAAQFAGGGAVAAQLGNTVHGAGVLVTGTVAAAAINGIAADSSLVLQPAAVAVTANTAVENVGLYLSNLTGAFTTGDGAFIINLRYRIVPTA